MLNAEKYKEKILEYYDKNLCTRFGVDKCTKKIIQCCSQACENCEFSVFEEKNKRTPCVESAFKWLLSEYKEPIKLTRTEYSLLRHVYKLNYKYIARDKDGDISLYLDEPDKDLLTEIWHGKEYEFTLFNNLFQFIKWQDKEPTLIKEVLNNCEVVENAKKQK